MSSSQNAFTQLPVCIPTQSIQQYIGAGFQCEFHGRFTTVHRGVWRRTQDEQIQIVHKHLKPEYRQSHNQVCHILILWIQHIIHSFDNLGIPRIRTEINVLAFRNSYTCIRHRIGRQFEGYYGVSTSRSVRPVFERS